MTLRPIELMRDRIRRARSDSDTGFFHELLYAGEFIARLTTAAMISAVDDDRERHRYRLVHSLVRADGLGEWARALDDTVTGPASQHIVPSARDDRRVLTERVGPESWQHTAVSLLIGVCGLSTLLVQQFRPGSPCVRGSRASLS